MSRRASTLTQTSDSHVFSAGSPNWRSSQSLVALVMICCILTNMVSFAMNIPVLPEVLSHTDANPTDIGFLASALIAVDSGASVIFFPICGLLADWANSRKVPIVVGIVVYAAAVVLFYSTSSVVMLFVSKITQGIFDTMFWAASLALCFDTIDPQRVGVVLGTVLTIADIAGLLSPILGGVLYTRIGPVGLVSATIILASSAILTTFLVLEGPTTRTAILDVKSTHSTENPTPNIQEAQPLLSTISDHNPAEEDLSTYILKPSNNKITNKLPILRCFQNRNLPVAMSLICMQAILIGGQYITIPLEARSLFNFTTEKAGLLFLPIGAARLAFGPLGGWAVDRYGIKRMGVISYTFFIPVLLMLHFVQPTPRTFNITLFSILLSLCGVAMSGVCTIGFIKTGSIVERYQRANPEIFGETAPYAASFGLNGMMFNLGMAIGPLLAGGLRTVIGYGNTMVVSAGIAALAAGLVALGMESDSSSGKSSSSDRKKIQDR